MSDVHSLDIYHWLSDIVPPLDSSLDSLTSTTVTHPPLDIPHKRKRSVDSVESHASKNPRLELGVVNQDLQADLQMSNIESPRAGRGKAKVNPLLDPPSVLLLICPSGVCDTRYVSSKPAQLESYPRNYLPELRTQQRGTHPESSSQHPEHP